MIWLLLFCIWLAWIVYRRRAWAIGRTRFAGIPRGKQIALSIGASILGPAMLLGGLMLLEAGGAFKGSLSIPSLAAITMLGVAFIELQMAAVAITGSLVSDTVTAAKRPSSKIAEPEEDIK